MQYQNDSLRIKAKYKWKTRSRKKRLALIKTGDKALFHGRQGIHLNNLTNVEKHIPLGREVSLEWLLFRERQFSYSSPPTKLINTAAARARVPVTNQY